MSDVSDGSKTKKKRGRPRGAACPSVLAPPQAAPTDLDRAADLPAIVATAYLETFERVGGVRGMTQWARKNPGAFYKQLAAVVGRAALVKGAKGRGLEVHIPGERRVQTTN